VNSLDFSNKIGYEFKDKALLSRALTHSSYVNDKKDGAHRNNERLEFLGDALFGAVISEELYKRLDRAYEGTLTKLKAHIVCEKSLAFYGKQIGVNESVFLGKGEECNGGREKEALIADALEAVIGAVFLDGGYEAARTVVLRIFNDRIEDAVAGRLGNDYKTELQERLQVGGDLKISYKLEREEGPDHDKVFYIVLYAAGKRIGAGQGKSKKEAEQNAAKEALERGVSDCTLKE